MKTSVAESSLNAYHGEIIGRKESRQCDEILSWMAGKGWLSRKQIARGMDMEPGTVAGRINELVRDGAVTVSHYLQPCPISGRRVHLVRCTESQPDLFGRAA